MPPSKPIHADVFHVTRNFFETTGIPLLRGRDFTPGGDEKHPVAIVNQIMARRLFGQDDPIGRLVREGDEQNKTYEIVGVAGDSKSVTLGEEVKACLYAYLPPKSDEVISLLGLLGERGANVIIAGGMGSRAQGLFNENGIKVVTGAPADRRRPPADRGAGPEPGRLWRRYHDPPHR